MDRQMRDFEAARPFRRPLTSLPVGDVILPDRSQVRPIDETIASARVRAIMGSLQGNEYMTCPSTRILIALALFSTLFPWANVHGQWTDDPSLNTPFALGSGDQVQPKLVNDGAGGCYLSWFTSTGGYDVYLQRFGPGGDALWGDGGLLVADRSFSSTEDYGLAVTSDGSAVLAYRGSGTSSGAMVSRVAPDGTIEWSVQASVGSSSVNAPAVAVASDGDIVAGWISGSSTSLRRLSPDGTYAWSSPVTISDGSNAALLADLQPGGDAGEVIASMVTYASFTGAKRLKARKVEANGSLAWSGNRSVFTSGSLQFGSFPTFVPDGSGGGLFAWYAVSPLQCHVQRLDADGNALFGTNGTSVTASSSGFLRTNPSLAFDADTGLLGVTWVEQVPNSSVFGYSAQRFELENGSRLWGQSGVAVGPGATHYDILGTSALVVDDAFIVAWNPESAFGVGEILAQRVDPDGALAWDEPTSVCTVASGHARLTGLAVGGQAVFAWQDDRDGNEDLYGQNVTMDGDLGANCTGDLNADGLVDGADLNILLGSWGACPDPSDCVADINGDASVDGADLNLLLGAWGACSGS
jgi:hypothetical protein